MEINHDMRLTTKEILDKEFKTSLKGYNQDQVDKFLDVIIQDYEAFQKQLEQLQVENERLRQEVRKTSESQTRTNTVGSTNYDILQRLSNLEKKVFGNKLDKS